MNAAKPTTADRIMRALSNGPMYEGALGLVLDYPGDFRRSLGRLAADGRIERDLPDQPLPWKLEVPR